MLPMKQLKNRKAQQQELLSHLNTCVGPVLGYVAPVWAKGIHQHGIDHLESIQKRGLGIIVSRNST